MTRPGRKHCRPIFPYYNMQNSGMSSWFSVQRFLSQQQSALITLCNKLTQNLVSLVLSAKESQRSLKCKYVRPIQPLHFMGLNIGSYLSSERLVQSSKTGATYQDFLKLTPPNHVELKQLPGIDY